MIIFSELIDNENIEYPYRLDISHNNNGIDNTTAELMHKWANIIGIRILVFHYTVYFQQESHAILFKLRWS